MTMSKKGVIIGAGEESLHAIKKMKEHNIDIYALDGNHMASGLACADEGIVIDITDLQAVFHEMDRIRPDFIVPVPIGRFLSVIGAVNEKYSLPGIKSFATERSTDKYLFHQLLFEAGLRKIKSCLINQNTDMSEVDMSFPAILKPRFGSGSKNVFYLSDSNELKKFYPIVQSLSEDFMLEQAVRGVEYGVDGAVINGNFFITLIRRKEITPLPMRQEISYTAVVRSEHNQQLFDMLISHLSKVTKLLQYQDCIFHADIIVNQEGVFVVEIAPRPSGYNLHNVFLPLAAGIDPIEQYIKFLLDEPYEFENKEIRLVQMCYFNFENLTICKIPSEEWLRNSQYCRLMEYKCNIHQGEYMKQITDGSSIMGRGYFVIEGEDDADLKQQREWIMKQFEKK